MITTIRTNRVFRHLENSKKRIIIEQGGARSGKTYNILIWIILKLLRTQKATTVSICRKTVPSIKKTVLRDFLNILKENNLYLEINFNKTSLEYKLNNHLIEFFSLDNPQKIRGGKRDILFLNEANEIDFESWTQLTLRTVDTVILDYNPSDEYHWIYENVLTRSDCDFFKTTYKDNPFLAESVKDEIERLKDVDENYWKIYGLGERGHKLSLIYKDFILLDKPPDVYDYRIFGIDYGINHPTALIEIRIKDGARYLDTIVYESNLSNPELIRKMKNYGIRDIDYIYPDSEDKNRNIEMQMAGFNIRPVDKSVKEGIEFCQRQKYHTTKDNVFLIKEQRNYSWKTKNGMILDEPVKFNDDILDALRYADFSHHKGQGNDNVISDALKHFANSPNCISAFSKF